MLRSTNLGRTVDEDVSDAGEDNEQGVLNSRRDQIDVARQIGHVEHI